MNQQKANGQHSKSENQQNAENNKAPTKSEILPSFNELSKNKKYVKKQKPLTTQQIQVFRQAFEIFDSNHSGSIDEQELRDLMRALGYDYSEKQIKRILEEVDEDGSGVIQIGEFVDFMSKHMLDTENLRKQFNRVFSHFDDDNSGNLDFRKIKTMVEQCFFNIDDDAITKMIEAADLDGDGKVSKYQFMRIMKKMKLL